MAAARSKRLWYLWYTNIFPLLSSATVVLALHLLGLHDVSKAWAALTLYFFLYRKLPYRIFKGDGEIQFFYEKEHVLKLMY